MDTQHFRLGYVVIIGILTLCIHSLLIDAYCYDHDHNLAVCIISSILAAILGLVTWACMRIGRRFEASIWFYFTLMSILLALSTVIPPRISLRLGFMVLILMVPSVYQIPFDNPIGTRTLIYVASIFTTVGSTALGYFVGHLYWSVTCALIYMWCITISYMVITYKNIQDINRYIAFVLFVGLILTAFAAAFIFEQHQTELLIVTLIMHVLSFIIICTLSSHDVTVGEDAFPDDVEIITSTNARLRL